MPANKFPGRTRQHREFFEKKSLRPARRSARTGHFNPRCPVYPRPHDCTERSVCKLHRPLDQICARTGLRPRRRRPCGFRLQYPAADALRKLDGLHSTPYRSMRQLALGALPKEVLGCVRDPKIAIQRLAPPRAVLILKKSAFVLMTERTSPAKYPLVARKNSIITVDYMTITQNHQNLFRASTSLRRLVHSRPASRCRNTWMPGPVPLLSGLVPAGRTKASSRATSGRTRSPLAEQPGT